MDAERWRVVNDILNEALEKEPLERDGFLARACANDPSLRKDVEALMSSPDKAGTFLESSGFAFASAEFVGKKVGPYDIQAQIGSGGMGKVYRAHDTRLGRDVAIKVALERFGERFEREARAVAALNHPNTCHLYDVGPNYLVMELIDGPTLADKIAQGPIPLDEALDIARQIADALEAAHEKEITHRDLKPANIKVKPDGTVKVLDFGLAKRTGISLAKTDNSPTITVEQTEAGVILGTAAYMSPEQAKGKAVDQRADIYSFGVVLYEMVTGKRLHYGDTITETLASVIKEEPKWDKVPAGLHRLLRRCLEKDPQKRLRHIGDVMSLVDEAPSTAQINPPLKPSVRGTRWVWIAVAAIGIAIAAIVAGLYFRQPVQTARVTRLQIPLPETMSLTLITSPIISPDGRWLAFNASGADGGLHMWIRALDSLELKQVDGAQGVGGAPPFWSPDSKFIAYPGGGKLRKVEIAGGPAQIICDLQGPGVQGGTWNRDGVIIIGGTRALMRVSDAGGAIAPVTTLAPGDIGHRWPQFLPDGHHFLYHRISSKPGGSGVFIGSIDVKPEEQSLKPLLLNDQQAMYAPSDNGGPGWLLFLRDGSLLGQRFDPATLQLSGDPAPLAAGIATVPIANYATFSASTTGSLVYRSGGSGRQMRLTWFDDKGRSMASVGDPAAYAYPAVSPDGKRVAIRLTSTQGNQDIWVLDVGRGTSTRLTFDAGRDDVPIWSPDGTKIVFASNRGGHFDIYQKAADGSGDDQLVLQSDEDKYPTDWSPDGRYLLYTVGILPKADVFALRLEDRKSIPFLNSEFTEGLARFSPDGRWVAYQSNESGLAEVYVRPFSVNLDGTLGNAGGKWMVSKGGGGFPNWRRDGKKVFYVGPAGVSAVDVTTDKTFQAGTPARLFPAPVPPGPDIGGGDVSRDGTQFWFVAPEGTSGPPPPFTVVLNWQAGLSK